MGLGGASWVRGPIVLKIGEAREQRTLSCSHEESAISLGKLDFHPRNRGKEAGVGSSITSVSDRPNGVLGAARVRPGKMGQWRRGMALQGKGSLSSASWVVGRNQKESKPGEEVWVKDCRGLECQGRAEIGPCEWDVGIVEG